MLEAIVSMLLKPIYLILAIYLVGCGSGNSGTTPQSPSDGGEQITCSTLSGHYSNEMIMGETLDIDANCNITDSYCGYVASYTIPSQAGDTVISVAGTNGTPGCMSSTAHACRIEFNGTDLGVACDNDTHLFLFKKQ